jgi:hypothetical protein
MADKQPHPQPPAGFQRPGIPGAGNILDPAVRGELREQIHEAVHGAAPQPKGARPEEAPSDEAATPAPSPPAAEPEPARPAYRAGPFPHGDVDLRGFAANVPPGPVRPQRGQAGRRFYFLPADPPEDAAPSVPAPQRPDGPKPG